MFQYTFMQNALIASILMAILCPSIGIFIVLRRNSMIGDTLSHASLAGISISLLLGTNPLLGAFAFTTLCGFLIEYLRSYFKKHTDLILSIILAFSVGLAITIMSSGKININVNSYMFGSILTVTYVDILTILILSILSVLTLFIYYNELIYITLDTNTSQILGIKIKKINYIFSILVASCIAVSIKIIGVLVLSSMITLPVATALQFKKGFRETLIISIIISLIDILTGLILSYYLNVAPGGFTALISVVVLMIVITYKKVGDLIAR